MIADLAEAHRIVPMFASLLPVSDYHKNVNPQYARSVRRPPASIVEVNSWIKALCLQRRFPYVDYYAVLVDRAGYLQADASDDGLHPNAKGYRLMAPVALTAIDNATGPYTKRGRKKPKAAQAQSGIRAELEKEHT
jgi:GDSL-like Lipase/Acylhydrolase family